MVAVYRERATLRGKATVVPLATEFAVPVFDPTMYVAAALQKA